MFIDGEKLAGIRKGQRIEEDAMNEREERDVRADAEGGGMPAVMFSAIWRSMWKRISSSRWVDARPRLNNDRRAIWIRAIKRIG